MILALVLDERQIHDPAPVRRRMREPVRILIVRRLLGRAPVGPRPPDLNFSTAEGVVINERAIRRIVGAVIEPLAGRDAPLVPALDGNRIDIELTLTPAHERQRLAVRRPAMP